MANHLLTVQEIARRTLPRLIDNLVFPNIVHKDFSEDFQGALGDTIRVRKPVLLSAKDFDPEQGVTPEDLNESAVAVTLDKIATVDVDIGALEGACDPEAAERDFEIAAAAALAEKINREGLALYKDIPTFVGTAGTTPATLSAFADARKQLNLQRVPVSGRVALWDPEADAAFCGIDAVVHAEKSGSVQALREGSVGRVMGMDHYMSQAVCVHQAGTLAVTSGSLKVKTAANGADKITLTATAMAGTLKKGDLIEIGTGSAKTQHTVTKDAEADENEIEVNIYPAATCAADTAVTLIGDHTANLAFHPMAFAFVTRPLVKPAGAESYVTSYNGISLRVVRSYDMTHKKEMFSMDVLYGFKTMYPELAVRVLG